jgi:hypothetical protein
MLSGSDSAKAKRYGSCGSDSGSTTLGKDKIFCTLGLENFNLDREFYLSLP